jgi:hypothetical protein
MKYAISLRKNIKLPAGTSTDNGNYPVHSFKPFRKFRTREQARAFKRTYSGNPVSIVNLTTQQVVR